MRALLLAVVFIAGCGPTICTGCGAAGPEPAPVIVQQPGKDLCPKACEHMAVTAPDGGPCEEATDITLKDGGALTCVQFCIYQHDNGIYWNTECLTKITSCDQVEACNTPPP